MQATSATGADATALRGLKSTLVGDRQRAAHTRRCDVRPYHGRASRRTLQIWQREEEFAYVAGMAAVVYGLWVRRRLVRWGATDEEVNGPYPGAERVRKGRRSATMAVAIDAPPDQVWPWLAQLGSGRGGWYSWDRLDNGGRHSAREVHPEWQDLAVGDRLKFSVPGGGLVDAY